ncbi:MAG: NAD(+)/NADH kinase [Thermoleophilia bacterium]|nr:NAD(+)/NADH kinase [Thermoleophilia bacterium]MDQ3858356.1 NAD(+)/NADH kinase [Actinomycetota bacterium]
MGTGAGEPVRRAALVHGTPETIGDAVARLERAADVAHVELVESVSDDPDVAVVLGGDGTMLRALRSFLGTRVPVFGVNFGRVGFLTSAPGDQLEHAVARVFAGEYRIVELCTLRIDLPGETHVAVNDAVTTSGRLGRMVQLGWEIGGEDLGAQPCDGMICSTPQGSTAYNLSNGGPVLMWGIDAMAITFIAPHSLHTRPLVVPRGLSVTITNRTRDLPVGVLADGHPIAELEPEESLGVGLGEERSRLALLPEVTFFARLHEVFP